MSKFVVFSFDGVVVRDARPYMGELLPEALEVLRLFESLKYNIVLKTDRKGNDLDDALNWFDARDIPIYAIHPTVVTKKAEYRYLRDPFKHEELLRKLDDSLQMDLKNLPTLIGARAKRYVNWEEAKKEAWYQNLLSERP